jgi:two-component system, NtrC family, response regulator
MANILIIDDDKAIGRMLSDLVKETGHDARSAFNLKDGLQELLSEQYDAVFLDVRLPDGNGLDALPVIRKKRLSPEVIIITGKGDPDGAELAIKNGAWDYVQKPFSVQQALLSLNRVLDFREQKKSRKPAVALRREGIIGHSPRMRDCLDLMAQAANTDASVLVTGETGTGKELFARAIHNNSSRADNAFVVVDCAALPETLVESTLFGHEKGAFTGADKRHGGLVKQADGGTLFLDEIGELPLTIQKAFLRVLQEYRFRPVGSSQEVASDFRVIAATNRNLDERVQAPGFRQDLLFRLRSTLIDLPPLRERPEDTKDLAIYYIAKVCDRYGIGIKGFSPEYFEALTTYSWPGNVRELINTLESSIASARDGDHTLFPIHLPMQIRTELARASIDTQPSGDNASHRHIDAFKSLSSLRELLDATEKRYLEDLISFTEGNLKEACRISGLSRSRFYDRLKKYGIRRRA